ncbi:hypothetical protein V8E54_013972 [Elaphomyces granulatus]
MTRRKRAIPASINKLKRAKQLKEDHTQKPVEPEDGGEIVLWNDVLVEESRKKADNKDEDFLLPPLRGPDIPVPIGDTRIFTVEISAGASIFSQFSIHCVLSGVPRWGNTFP